MVELEERVQRLKDALAAGKITQELFNANMAKIQKELDAIKAAAAPAPTTKECPICDTVNDIDALECKDCGMDMHVVDDDEPTEAPEPAVPKPVPAPQPVTPKPAIAKPAPKPAVTVPPKAESDEDILADIMKQEDVSSEEPEAEADELDLFLESLSSEDEEKRSAASTPKKAADEDDDLLLDDLFDSLVLREEELECPLCGASLPKGTTMCTNCSAQLTEEGDLKEEVAIETLADSIEDGLAELEGLAEEIISEEVEEVPAEEPVIETGVPVPEGEPQIEPPKITKPSAEEPVVDTEDIDIPDKLDITEEELPKIHMLGIRMIDIVVFGTVIGLVAVFAIFGLWDMANMTTMATGIFFGIAIAGMVATFMLFRISTSAIAEGDRQFKAGNYDQAMGNYERAIRFSNKPASAWTSKGVAQKRLGDYGAALRSHNAAIKLDPKNEIAWCNKGDLLYRLERLELALECYDNAIDINKRYAIAWNNKGTTLAKLGRFKEAKVCQDIATKLKPRYAAAWVNKGEILAKLGQRQEAIVCYQKAKKLVGA